MDANIPWNICFRELEIQAYNKSKRPRDDEEGPGGLLSPAISGNCFLSRFQKLLQRANKIEIFAAETALTGKQEFVLSWKTLFVLAVEAPCLPITNVG